ncbi:phosphotransferase [Nocardia sp. CA-119907]|uniref:phosphotransferase n=1 Tax=Nocardia sp. CA-119907 TaxID=3239973 RepID=UPI003D975D66
MTKSVIGNDAEAEHDVNWARTVLEETCAAVGLNPTGAELIKFTNNAVFALQQAPVVVRIPGSSAVGNRVSKVISVARWLAEHDMPSVRLIEELPEPLSLGDHSITFWHRVIEPQHAAPPNGHDLGRILHRYHALPAADLPTWQPLTAIRQRIAEENVLTSAEHQFLLDICDDVEDALAHVDYRLPIGPIHADGFVGNLIAGPRGAVICDFDSASYGPREWDLTPVAVGKLRFAYGTDHHSQLVAEYGTDVMDWPDFPVLRRVRELQLVTSVLPVLHANPSLTDQWRYRFTTFRDNDSAAIWTPYR